MDTLVLCEPKGKSGKCASRANYGPTETDDCYKNDTTICPREGGWGIDYSIVEGVRNGTDLWEHPDKSYDTGETVSLSWEDTDGHFECTVKIDGIPCNSCRVCSLDDSSFSVSSARYGGGSFSADCTNVDRGRKVKCEPGLPLFYPRVSNKEARPTENYDAGSQCVALSDQRMSAEGQVQGGFGMLLGRM
jgi:hypothetical protein